VLQRLVSTDCTEYFRNVICSLKGREEGWYEDIRSTIQRSRTELRESLSLALEKYVKVKAQILYADLTKKDDMFDSHAHSFQRLFQEGYISTDWNARLETFTSDITH